MAWRAGAEWFADVWPLIESRLRDKRQRREFTAALLRLLVEFDVEPADVADVHLEVRAALAAIGVEVPPAEEEGDAVAVGVRGLASDDPAARAASAEALRHFVASADDPTVAAAVALPALAEVLNDPVPKVRREAALSIRVLVRAGHPLPRELAARLRAATRHDDEVVAGRVREALAASQR
jgi:hypothetical protein